MATINEIARRRLAIVRELKRGLKAVDTAVEIPERYINRLLSRKRMIVESDEFETIAQMFKRVDEALDVLVKYLEDVYIQEIG